MPGRGKEEGESLGEGSRISTRVLYRTVEGSAPHLKVDLYPRERRPWKSEVEKEEKCRSRSLLQAAAAETPILSHPNRRTSRIRPKAIVKLRADGRSAGRGCEIGSRDGRLGHERRGDERGRPVLPADVQLPSRSPVSRGLAVHFVDRRS